MLNTAALALESTLASQRSVLVSPCSALNTKNTRIWKRAVDFFNYIFKHPHSLIKEH